MNEARIPDEASLIYDWSTVDAPQRDGRAIEFDDETLRDGLQSPSIRDPGIYHKLRILHLMEDLGIHAADLGLPGASDRQRRDVRRLVQEIVREGLAIRPNCAARTLVSDIEPICDIADEVGLPIEVACFIGSSPIRVYTEDWSLDGMLRNTETAVGYAVERGMPVNYVTEDTTRAHPNVIRALYTAAIEAGARRICICDTVGHTTPHGVAALLREVRKVVADTGEDVRIDWHGHRDRGLDIANTLMAIEAGVDRVHATALGIGERSGNTPMDLLLVNCKLLGWIDNDLSKLSEYCEEVSAAVDIEIPINYPVVGEDAFRTATGVHAAALIKAHRKGHDWLADRVYSGVPAGWFGRRQKIEIGPMSGASNIVHWLQENGFEPTDARVEALLAAAKDSDSILDDVEIRGVIDGS